MADPIPRRRRWFQFGLRTMFVVITVFALIVSYHVNWIRQRHAALATCAIQGPSEQSGLPWMLRVCGETGCSRIVMHIKNEEQARMDLTSNETEELRRMRALFPEAEVKLFSTIDSGGSVNLIDLPWP